MDGGNVRFGSSRLSRPCRRADCAAGLGERSSRTLPSRQLQDCVDRAMIECMT